MEVFENQRFGEERALYGKRNLFVRNCQFKGEEDGESALKECRDIQIEYSHFDLRYPLWHVKRGTLSHCIMSDTCRAALWYDDGLILNHMQMDGIKAVRECKNVKILDSQISSQEFGWFCKDMEMKDVRLNGEYPLMHSRKLLLENMDMKGKYSFQYTKDVVIKNSVLDTKDAFWHSKNVTVYDSVVKGEYLAWYSEGLKLVRCKIIGTQPLCYCKNLVLEDCEMMDCDLSFEKSEVHATVKGTITSIKNPECGVIRADSIKEILFDEFRSDKKTEIITKI